MTGRVAALVALGLGAIVGMGAMAAAPPTAMTDTGSVQGFERGGIQQFLGIPYAAPPVGPLRWQPPQPPAAWAGTRDATHFGGTCAQVTTLGVFAGPVSANEDCLYLNVFTKDVRGKAPVLVWIHGGGLFDGESNDYDAAKLVKGGPMGPAVVVTINYRLGLLGFLAHPALDAEGHPFGNYGVLDQQAALQWVKRNIAAFGGDPGNVTLGGQSAGATSAAVNVISPLAKGLFSRAIFESGPLLTVASKALAEQRGQDFASAAGCGPNVANVAACLRALSVDTILKLQGTASANSPYVNGFLVDGTILPIPGDVAWATGRFARMPIMNGNVADEGGFAVSIDDYFFGPVTAEKYAAYIAKTFGGPAGPGNGPPNYPPGTVEKVAARYPIGKYPSLTAAWIALQTDPTACRNRALEQLLADKVPLYAYEFQDRQAPWYFPDVRLQAGAAHTADIQYLFQGYRGGPTGVAHELNPAQRRLSDRMVAAWTNFMYAGDPNGAGADTWPRYTAVVPVLSAQRTEGSSTTSAAEFGAAHQCDFWDGITMYRTPTT